jgi:cytochrome d ubiquinol oxidase subunit I
VIAGGLLATVLEARWLMGFALAYHIVLASLGVGMPVLMLWAEGRWLRTRDPGWRALARRWSEVFALLFAVGAVTGTALSFLMGLLWPRFVSTFGAVIGLPFTLETFAFFVEAIFLGIYFYGWERLSPRAHWWCGVPVAIAGLASAAFVVTANAWMNAPVGFAWDGVRVTDVRPWEAMASPVALPQAAHMILAAYVLTGFVVAAVHAGARRRGRDTEHHRRGTTLALALGAALMPVQALVGHQTAQAVAETQPVKLAAMEGQFATEARAPLRIGGWPDPEAGRTPFAIEVPGGLSWLAHGDADAVVLGLSDVPPRDRPPVVAVHVSFQVMVGCGVFLLVVSAWAFGARLVRRRWPSGRAFLGALVVSGPVAVLAVETGWMVTELGRQPWIVQGLMRVEDAATDAPGVGGVLAATVAAYALLAVATALGVRRVVRRPLHGEEATHGS